MNFLLKNKKTVFYYDYWTILVTCSLLFVGFLLLASASMGISDKWYKNPLHFLSHQAIFLAISIIFVWFVKLIPIVFWEKISGYLLIISMLLLIAVVFPGIGYTVNGSTRWIRVGILSLQASEFVKLAILVYTASYLSRYQDEVRRSIKGCFRLLLILGIISFLLILEPDFGAIVVLVLTTLGMMYLAGARLWQYMILLLLVIIVLGVLAIVSPYRLMRLTSFLNPWSKPFDSGYQLVQSLIAFGRGGVFGVGLGNSIQKLFYLPEAHTDFLFAILAEEFGIVGQIVVLGLFTFLVAHAFHLGRIASKIKSCFSSYLSYGIGLLIGIQMLINVGVNVGLLPTKGLTLPFMSYGGSSMLFNCVTIAILLRIYHEITITSMIVSKPYFSNNKGKGR